MTQLVARNFKVVGERNKGLFKDYAKLVPEAAQVFLKRVDQLLNNTGIEVTVYEPPKNTNHLEGTFYVGVLVDEKTENLPNGLEYIEVQQQYAMTKGKVTEMGELYTRLDNWIETQGYQHEVPEHYIIEVYYPGDAGEDVEVYIPVKEVYESNR